MSATKRFSPAAKALIKEASDKIFQNLPIVQHKTGFKLFRRMPIGPIVSNYFPIDTTQNFRDISPGFETLEEEIKRDRFDRMKKNGKGPPKKGQGKRSSKKK